MKRRAATCYIQYLFFYYVTDSLATGCKVRHSFHEEVTHKPEHPPFHLYSSLLLKFITTIHSVKVSFSFQNYRSGTIDVAKNVAKNVVKNVVKNYTHIFADEKNSIISSKNVFSLVFPF